MNSKDRKRVEELRNKEARTPEEEAELKRLQEEMEVEPVETE